MQCFCTVSQFSHLKIRCCSELDEKVYAASRLHHVGMSLQPDVAQSENFVTVMKYMKYKCKYRYKTDSNSKSSNSNS